MRTFVLKIAEYGPQSLKYVLPLTPYGKHLPAPITDSPLDLCSKYSITQLSSHILGFSSGLWMLIGLWV